MRPLLAALAVLAALAATAVHAQSDIRPPTTARLPPLPGESLSVPNQAYIEEALAAAQAQIEAGRLAAERASSDRLRQFGTVLAQDYQGLAQALGQIAGAKGFRPPPTPVQDRLVTALQRLSGLSGPSFEQEFLSAEAQAHRRLIDLYQRQAAETQDLDLRTFAAERLLTIKRNLDQLQKLAAESGVRIETPENPPQY